MQAVLLAAGRSTRTFPLTSTRPKPLIPVWDRPLLGHQLRQLSGIVDEALIIVGYRREQIEAFFGEEYASVRLRYVVQQEQRGTADAVAAARPFLTGRALVLNGDDLYHKDDLRALAEGGRGLLVTRAPDPQNRAVVRVEQGAIVDIVEKPDAPPENALCSVGGYAFEAEDLELLDDLPVSPRGELELPDFILRLLEKHRVRPQPIERFWIPITYAWDVLKAIQELWGEASRARELGVEPETHVTLRRRTDVRFGDGVSLDGPIHLGAGVTLGDGAAIWGPACIGEGSVVDDGAVIASSALFDGVRIGAGAEVRDSVLGSGVKLGARAVLTSCDARELSIDVRGKTVVPELERLGTIVGDGAQIEDGAEVPAGSLVPPRRARA